MQNEISFTSQLAKFGVGLFETMKVSKGEILFLNEHLNRLYTAANDLAIEIKPPEARLKKELVKYVKGVDNKALRITVCDQGYNLSLRDIPYQKEDYKRGYRLMIAPIRLGNNILNKYKTTNYFKNLYAKRKAQAKGYDEALLLNLNDIILEGSMSNIFFIKANKLITPAINLALLPGITRDKVIKLAKDLDLELKFSQINLTELETFEAAFITNSLIDLMPVKEIAKREYQLNHPIYNLINKEFQLLVSNNKGDD